jgi:hypothetical protein
VDLTVAVAIPLESVRGTPAHHEGYRDHRGLMYREKHSLFVRRMEMGVGMEIEIGVWGFMIDSMAQ